MLAQATGHGLSAWQAAALLALVAVGALVDLRAGRVPNWVTFPAIVVGLAGHALVGGTVGLAGSVGGFAAGFLPLLVFWLAGGLGGGDAKLTGAIGAIGGWRLVVGTMLYGSLIAALMAVVVMVRRRIVWRTLKRIGHAVVLTVMPGARPADPTSADSPKIPVAVALCLGTLAAMLEVIWQSGPVRGLLNG